MTAPTLARSFAGGRSFLSEEGGYVLAALEADATPAAAVRQLREYRRGYKGAMAPRVSWWAPLEHLLAEPRCWLTIDPHGYASGERADELLTEELVPAKAFLVLLVISNAGAKGAKRSAINRELATAVRPGVIRDALKRLEAGGWVRREKGHHLYRLARELRR